MKADAHEIGAELSAELQGLRTKVLERLDKLEARRLPEFRIWDTHFASRFRASEILIGGFNERLILLAERVTDIERRKDV